MKDIVLINEADYSQLLSDGSFTKNGITHYYSNENLYIIDSIVNNVEHALTADYATRAGTSANATYLTNKPVIQQSANDSDAINIVVGGKKSDDLTVPYADYAGTTSTLSSNPSFSTVGTTQIKLTAGGRTSSPYTVPYASNAGSVDWDDITNIPHSFAPESHNHDDRYVTSLGTSGNYVTWTKNGSTNNLTVPYATSAGTAEKVTIYANSANAAYNIVFNSGSSLYSDSDIRLNPSTGEVTAKHFTVTHAAGGQNEYRLKYSTTVDMAMMIGSGNANHGLYDIHNSKWMIVADAAGNVTMNGNATTATTLATTRTLWGQNFNGSANVTGNMTSVGSISASGDITTTKSGTNAVKISVKNNSTNEIGLYTSTNRGIYDFTSQKWLIAYNAASTYTYLGIGNVGVGCEPTVKLDVNGQIKSRSATGTAPFVVSSTTKVNNLNADFLDGEHNYNLRSIPDNGGDVLFSIFPYIDSRINPFNKVVDIDVAPGDAPFGYCFGPIVNYSQFVSTYISVTPGDKIRGEVYAYRDSEATATNNGVLYCGISRYDRNKKPISSNAGNHYFVASNSTVPSDGVWHKYSGTVTIPTEHTIYNGSDGGGVYYVKIILYVDYNKNDCIPTYIGGLQFTKLDNNYNNYLPLAGGTMTGAINRNYTDASDVPVLNVSSNNKDIWLWRVRSADAGTSASVSGVYGFGAKYIGTGTDNDNSWAMFADNRSGTQVKALEMKQSGDVFAYAPIHWANSTALPEDTSPQYLLTIDSFANGGKTKWTSKANLATAIGLGNYLPLAGGTMTGHITMGGQAIYFGKTGSNGILQYSSGYPNYGIWYHDESVDKMTFSATGNANSVSGADFAINGAGDGTLTARGNVILHEGNYDTYINKYVKLDAGAAEQTIKSSIGSLTKGVIDLWRNSGDHYTFLGFSNGTTESFLGGIGFKSQADHELYIRRTTDNTTSNVQYWQILHTGNTGLCCTTGKFNFDPQTRKIQSTKTNSGWGDAQVYSTDGYADNVVLSFKSGETNKTKMIGLNSDPTTDAGYQSIDYCWYIYSDGSARIYESGTNRGIFVSNYAIEDEFRIEYMNGTVQYYHNGELKRSVARNISGKLYFDSTFYNAGSIYDYSFTISQHTFGDLSSLWGEL